MHVCVFLTLKGFPSDDDLMHAIDNNLDLNSLWCDLLSCLTILLTTYDKSSLSLPSLYPENNL